MNGQSYVAFFPYYNLEEFKLNLSEQHAVAWSKYCSKDIINHICIVLPGSFDEQVVAWRHITRSINPKIMPSNDLAINRPFESFDQVVSRRVFQEIYVVQPMQMNSLRVAPFATGLCIVGTVNNIVILREKERNLI